MKRYSPLFMILVLLGILAASQIAPAAATATIAPTAFEEFEAEEDEGEFEESEFEDCEAGEEEEFDIAEVEEFEEEGFEFEAEGEECGEGAAAKKHSAAGGPVSAPAACLVRQAESKITTLPGTDRVELTVHYATWSPGAVSIELKLKDHKGTLGLEHAVKHLGLGGTLHLTTKLSDAVMERAADASEFDISLRAGNTPGYCGNLLEQRLRTSHPAGRARVYSAPRGT
jgi:hypothetical protein